MSFSLLLHFLLVFESGDQCLLNSKVLSCFSGVIMSIIRSFFLLLGKIWAPGMTGHPYIYTRCPVKKYQCFINHRTKVLCLIHRQKFVCVMAMQ